MYLKEAYQLEKTDIGSSWSDGKSEEDDYEKSPSNESRKVVEINSFAVPNSKSDDVQKSYTDNDLEDVCYSSTDSNLSDLGKKQSRESNEDVSSHKTNEQTTNEENIRKSATYEGSIGKDTFQTKFSDVSSKSGDVRKLLIKKIKSVSYVSSFLVRIFCVVFFLVGCGLLVFVFVLSRVVVSSFEKSSATIMLASEAQKSITESAHFLRKYQVRNSIFF
jgi:hypothetical protein